MKSCKFFALTVAALILAGGWAMAANPETDSIYPTMYEEDAQGGAAATATDACSDCSACGDMCNSGCPRWEVGVDYIMLDRFGGKSQMLLQHAATGEKFLDNNDFNFGFQGGPRVTMVRHGDRGYDLEFVYFNIDGWSNTKNVPADPDGYVFQSQTTAYTINGPTQIDYKTKLYNGELNMKWHPTERVQVLVGFRWDEMNERLSGVLFTGGNTATIGTTNDLLGFQVGTEARLLERNKFTIDSIVKAGFFNNRATLNALDHVGTAYRGSTDHGAFIGELGLQAKYQFTSALSARLGYQLLWLDGIATAPAQLANADADSLNVLTNGTAWYHGFNVGMEYKF